MREHQVGWEVKSIPYMNQGFGEKLGWVILHIIRLQGIPHMPQMQLISGLRRVLDKDELPLQALQASPLCRRRDRQGERKMER